MSHPTWVCGLKPCYWQIAIPGNKVTPYVGVWIETGTARFGYLNSNVTPYVGVWIETYCCLYSY